LDELSNSAGLKELHPFVRKRAQALPALGAPMRAGDLGSLDDLAIESVLGRGGMGIVFRGREQRLGRDVAVKFLLPGSSPLSEKRFIREARALAALKHENIVPVYHIGQNSEGQDFIVSPLIVGQTLRERIQSNELEPLEPREAAEIIEQIAGALACAHAAGLVHRDVKPANILLDRIDGRAKITDFGLVRATEDATLTQADLLCGTPEYMTPEQATLGDQVDGRSDIYSLGVTLYECLTGATPFRGRPLEIIDQHRSIMPIPPSKLNRAVPTDLETICLKAISKEIDGRFQTMREFGDDLNRFLCGQPIMAKPASAVRRLRLWTRRNPGLSLALASTIGSLLIGTIAASGLWLQSAANARQSQRLADQLGIN
jgi:serine/threonine-protein kinase